MWRFSPYAVLEQNAAKQAEQDAIIIEGDRISYGSMFESVDACANWLIHNGIAPGDSVGLSIRDDVGHIICATALLCIGAQQISLGAHENSEIRRKLAARVGASTLIVERVEPWMQGLTTVVFPVGNLRELSSAPAINDRRILAPRAIDSVALYRSTSGSTNLPKTFELSLARVCQTAEINAADAKERRTLRSGSVEFDANRLARIGSLLAGNASIILRRLDAGHIVASCERDSVSMITMGVYKLASLVQTGSGCRKLPSFTAFQTGGSRVSPVLREQVKDLLTDKLWIQYATSEVGLISLAAPDQHDEFPDGVGYPHPSVTLEIVGPDGARVAAGEIGEIRLRKEVMTSGYLSERGVTNFREGWFYPGDLVSQAAGAPLVFHGRSDDMIMLNSINVFLSAIEDTLSSHPDVQEAVAYPIKSRIHGEIPAAAVVLASHAQARDTAYLLEYCRKSLGIRAPRQIVALERIPRNSVGKPLRRELSRG